jgi:voltage-gated potassium channel
MTVTAPEAEGSKHAIGLYTYIFAAGLAGLLALQRGGVDFRVGIRAWVDRRLNPKTGDSKAVETFIILLIAVNVVAVMAETEVRFAETYGDFFLINEAISTLIFSVEYILRVWVAPFDPRFAHPVKGRLRYASTAMALVDIIAIAPFFLMFIKMDLRIARAIRLMRLLRILKIGRYAHAVKMMGTVINTKKEELAITLFVSVMILVLCSSAMYFAEHESQPEAFGSIPETMWWAVVTLTSVGYGDVSPTSPVGQVVGAVVCLIGVLLVALPTGILASGFLEVMREVRRGDKGYRFDYCPHCGEQLPEEAEPD